MLYAIFCEDFPDSTSLRAENRPDHLARLTQLLDEGRLVLAGPHPAIDSPDSGPAGTTGSLIVAEFESLDSAKAWANQDPFLLRGVYARVTVKPFIQALP